MNKSRSIILWLYCLIAFALIQQANAAIGDACPNGNGDCTGTGEVCDVGDSLGNGQDECTCDLGYYDSSSTCTACDEGNYKSAIGLDACTQAQQGYFAADSSNAGVDSAAVKQVIVK